MYIYQPMVADTNICTPILTNDQHSPVVEHKYRQPSWQLQGMKNTFFIIQIHTFIIHTHTKGLVLGVLQNPNSVSTFSHFFLFCNCSCVQEKYFTGHVIPCDLFHSIRKTALCKVAFISWHVGKHDRFKVSFYFIPWVSEISCRLSKKSIVTYLTHGSQELGFTL